MGNGSTADRRLNMASLFVSVLVFGTGLILLFEFHVAGGAHRTEFFGLGRGFWLGLHEATAIAFVVCSVAHIQRHWKYLRTVATRWRANLPRKTKSTIREQALLFVAALVAVWAGFYAWVVFPGATLEHEEFHRWIDVHNRVGLLLLIGMGVHIKRRWRRIFISRGGAARRDAPPAGDRLTGGKNAS